MLVATEVEVMGRQGLGQCLVGQRREVRHHVAHLGKTSEHALVVFQGLVVIERGFLLWVELVAVHQATGRLVDHHQFNALALEGFAQLLETAKARRRGGEFGAQVFLGTE